MRTANYLYALHIVHVYAREVDILHCLASQTLAIHKDEHTLSGKTTNVHVQFLVHGVCELHTRQFLLEKVAQVCGIGLCNVLPADDTREHRSVLERARCACGGDDQFAHIHITGGVYAHDMCVSTKRNGTHTEEH